MYVSIIGNLFMFCNLIHNYFHSIIVNDRKNKYAVIGWIFFLTMLNDCL